MTDNNNLNQEAFKSAALSVSQQQWRFTGWTIVRSRGRGGGGSGGVSTQIQSYGLVAHENSTFRNLALALSGPFMP